MRLAGSLNDLTSIFTHADRDTTLLTKQHKALPAVSLTPSDTWHCTDWRFFFFSLFLVKKNVKSYFDCCAGLTVSCPVTVLCCRCACVCINVRVVICGISRQCAHYCGNPGHPDQPPGSHSCHLFEEEDSAAPSLWQQEEHAGETQVVCGFKKKKKNASLSDTLTNHKRKKKKKQGTASSFVEHLFKLLCNSKRLETEERWQVKNSNKKSHKRTEKQ